MIHIDGLLSEFSRQNFMKTTLYAAFFRWKCIRAVKGTMTDFGRIMCFINRKEVPVCLECLNSIRATRKVSGFCPPWASFAIIY